MIRLTTLDSFNYYILTILPIAYYDVLSSPTTTPDSRFKQHTTYSTYNHMISL